MDLRIALQAPVYYHILIVDSEPYDMLAIPFDVSAAARLLDTLGSPVRLKVVRILAEGEISVTALAGRLGMSHSAISQHLKKMRERGVVRTRRSSQTIYYSLPTASPARILLAVVDRPLVLGTPNQTSSE